MIERTYNTWSEKEEAKLVELYNQELTNFEIMQQLDRNKNSINHRISLLKERKLINMRRKKSTNKEAYYANANRIIENFKRRALKTKHGETKLGKISDVNYKLILDMDSLNQADGLADNTRSNYLRYLNEVALALNNKSFLDCELEKDIHPFTIRRQKELKESAFQPYKSSLKGFFKYLLEKNPDKTNLLEIYNFFNKKKRGKKNNSEDIDKEHLTRKEVVKLVASIKGSGADAIRDRALIAVTYDSGARISEVLAVTQKDTKADEKVPRLWLPISKTKTRYCNMLKFSLPYLMDWIKIHEYWDNEDAPLFYSLSTSNYGEPILRARAGQILSRAMKISKIDKKISLHSLRHSKAFHMAEERMLISEANKLFGWAKTSGMFHYYSAIADKELELKELERAGKLTPEQIEERKLERNAFHLKSCLRCHESVTPDQFACPKCGISLRKETAQKEIASENKINDMAKQMEDLKKGLEVMQKLYEKNKS